MAKFVYNQDDIHMSDGFAPDRYATADDIREHKRKRKKVDKADRYAMILDYVDENNIMEFHTLRKRITSDFPELTEALYDKWNMFKAYCDSRRLGAANGFGSMSYDEMAKEYKRISHDYDYIRESSQNLRETNEELKTENLNLRKYIMEVSGSLAGDSNPEEFWQNVDFSISLVELQKQNKTLNKENSSLRCSCSSLEDQNKKLKQKLLQLQKKLDSLESLDDYAAIYAESEENLL